MSEEVRDIYQRYILSEEYARKCVAQVMKPDFSEVIMPQKKVKMICHIIRRYQFAELVHAYIIVKLAAVASLEHLAVP